MKKSILLSICLLFIPAVIFAAPSISGVSGTVSDGSTITISGSDFGAKATAAPTQWQTWESATAAQTPVQVGWWDSSDNATVSTANQRTGSSKSLLLAYPADGNGGSYAEKGDVVTDKVYVSFWIRWDWGEADPDNNWQIKYFRLNQVANGGTQEYPSIAAFAWAWAGTPAYRTELQHLHENASCANISAATSYITMPSTSETPSWIQIAVQVDQTDMTAVDTWYWISKHQLSDVYYSATQSNIDMQDDCAGEDAEKLDDIKIGGSCESGASAVNIYLDDFYFDTSWARVEIGDNATYANCTHREIQIPSAWAADEITIDVNQGGLNSLNGQYLFVVDSDGTASAGHLIDIPSKGSVTIGGGSQTVTIGGGSHTMGVN